MISLIEQMPESSFLNLASSKLLNASQWRMKTPSKCPDQYPDSGNTRVSEANLLQIKRNLK